MENLEIQFFEFNKISCLQLELGLKIVLRVRFALHHFGLEFEQWAPDQAIRFDAVVKGFNVLTLFDSDSQQVLAAIILLFSVLLHLGIMDIARVLSSRTATLQHLNLPSQHQYIDECGQFEELSVAVKPVMVHPLEGKPS